MNTPTAALAWELWRKHRRHLIFIAGTLLFFILVYPTLCGRVKYNPDNPDGSDEFAHQLAVNLGQSSLPGIMRMLTILFLTGGPMVAMVMTLLYVVWMFTFTEVNPKTKDPMAFPAQLFNLPISTSFLFWQIVLGGMAAILGLCATWIYCVRLPHFESFTVFQNGFAWVTLLALVQAIVWSLANSPFTRLLALITAGSLFVYGWQHLSRAESLLVLPPLLLLGVVLARAGLQKMRHGQWQGWAGPWPFARRKAGAAMRGPRRFASPAQAQLWFEWRRSARGLCCLTALLVFVPVTFVVTCHLAGCDPLSLAAMDGFSLYLAYMPLFVCLAFGLVLGQEFAQGKRDQPFVLIHPLTSGELVTVLLKIGAISTVLTWAAILAAFALMPWLGNFHAVQLTVSPFLRFRIALVMGLIFLTWRLAVINLGLGLTGNRWFIMTPIGVPLAIGMGWVMFHNVLDPNDAVQNWLWHHFLVLAAGLLAVKFLLAGAAFRACLKHRLLAPSILVHYLLAWALLVVTLLATLLLLARPGGQLMLPACLSVVLLVPLARIGFAPLALAWNRHYN